MMDCIAFQRYLFNQFGYRGCYYVARLEIMMVSAVQARVGL